MQKILTGPYKVILGDSEAVSREEWLKERKKGVCSSDFPQVVGMSSFGSAVGVYEDKINPEVVETEVTESQKFLFDFGHAVEPKLHERIASLIRATAVRDKRMVESTRFPYMRNNCDGLFLFEDDITMYSVTNTESVRFKKDDIIMFEAKTSHWTLFDRWDEIRMGPLPEHVAQCKHGMITRGFDWCVISYCRGSSLERDVVYHLIGLTDEDRITIPVLCENFFEGHVLSKIPPVESYGSKAEVFKKALIAHYQKDPAPRKPEIKLPAHTLPLFERRLEIDEQIKNIKMQDESAKIERDKIDSQLISLLGAESQKGVLESLYRVFTASVSTSSTPTVTTESLERLKAEEPKLYQTLADIGIITVKYRSSFKVSCKQKKPASNGRRQKAG